MKTKRHWYIAACLLLAMIIAVTCICWVANSDSHSETPTLATTTSSAVTTLTSVTETTTATTTSTEAVTTTSTAIMSSTTNSQATKTTLTKVTAHSKPSSNNTTTTTHNSVDLSGMEYINGEYYDKSKLTFTQADVGKVVGYSPTFNRDIIVIRVDEKPTADGRRAVCIILGHRGLEGGWSPSGFCMVECEYCHEFPCPDGGDEACSEYDVKLDGRITCQRCGLPQGNGYYGTCRGLIDWDNGGIISCNHYLNCLKCGRPVGDGYNGTCHVTWGDYPGVTTCNHYD